LLELGICKQPLGLSVPVDEIASTVYNKFACDGCRVTATLFDILPGNTPQLCRIDPTRLRLGFSTYSGGDAIICLTNDITAVLGFEIRPGAISWLTWEDAGPLTTFEWFGTTLVGPQTFVTVYEVFKR
jgi:hypothetical protein